MKIKKKLNNRAEGYIESAVAVVVAMMLVVFILNIFSFLTIKQDMDYFAKQMIDAATTFGRTNNEVTARYDELCEELGFSPEYSFDDTAYYNTNKKTVQLGETIKVQITYKKDLIGFGLFNVPLTLQSSHSGLSERYWK